MTASVNCRASLALGSARQGRLAKIAGPVAAACADAAIGKAVCAILKVRWTLAR